MVTAETAVVLPVLLLVLAGAVAAVVVVGAQLRCVDAAREGARAAARGDATRRGGAAVARRRPRRRVTDVSVGGEHGPGHGLGDGRPRWARCPGTSTVSADGRRGCGSPGAAEGTVP